MPPGIGTRSRLRQSELYVATIGDAGVWCAPRAC
jgi:hypothetical protein